MIHKNRSGQGQIVLYIDISDMSLYQRVQGKVTNTTGKDGDFKIVPFNRLFCILRGRYIVYVCNLFVSLLPILKFNWTLIFQFE